MRISRYYLNFEKVVEQRVIINEPKIVSYETKMYGLKLLK